MNPLGKVLLACSLAEKKLACSCPHLKGRFFPCYATRPCPLVYSEDKEGGKRQSISPLRVKHTHKGTTNERHQPGGNTQNQKTSHSAVTTMMKGHSRGTHLLLWGEEGALALIVVFRALRFVSATLASLLCISKTARQCGKKIACQFISSVTSVRCHP